MDYSKLFFPASDYKITISCNGIMVPLMLVESFDYSRKIETEVFHAIGSIEPQGIQSNTATYEGKIQIEAGELQLFLIALGYQFASEISGATIAICTSFGDIVKIFKNCALGSDDRSVKAKEKRSLASIDFKSTGVMPL